MLVEQLMNRPLVVCGADDTLNTAARLMWDHDVGAVPVVDADNRLIGIITDRDICMAAYAQGRTLHDLRVGTSMAREVHTCAAGDTVASAEKVMMLKQVRRLPVVDGDRRPIGMFALGDLARAVSTTDRVRIGTRGSDGLDREVLATLAAICEPRAQALEIVDAN